MKRKLSSVDDEDTRLGRILFSKSEDLVDKLKPAEISDEELNLKPVWIDEDDELFQETDTQTNSSVKLKQRYESLIGTPSWAKLNNNRNEPDDEDNALLRTVGHIQKRQLNHLPNKNLELKRLPLINSETRDEGRFISCIEFHPKLSVALVAGNSGNVSLFSINGDSNNLLQNFKLKSWTAVNNATFTPEGTEALLASNAKSYFCAYDLIKAQEKIIRLPPTLEKLQIFELSPDGKRIAVSDGYDEIFILDATSKLLTRSLKHNSKVNSVTFSHNSEQLYCYCVQGEITLWDMSTFKPLKKFHDNGCVTASCITTSTCGRLLATGSAEGIVNIYETSKINSLEPVPVKTISNLTTQVNNLKFNATTEILAAFSNALPNALKLIHIPSYQVFQNFPSPTDNLSRVVSVNFSPNSGYMALGNDKGCALLYRLKYYKNY